MFEIDLGEQHEARPFAKSRDTEGLVIRLHDFARADRLHRQVIQNVYACETREMLDAYLQDEAPLLEALSRSWPDLRAAVADAEQTQAACLR